MKFRIFYKNFLIVFITDVLLLTAAIVGAHLIRFDFSVPMYFGSLLKQMLPWVLLVKLACFYYFDLYRGMWRYTSIADLLNIIKASTVGTLIVVLFILFRYRFIGYSRSIFLIDWCLTILLIAGFRMSVRLFFEYFSTEKPTPTDFLSLFRFSSPKNTKSKNLIIIGAGDCGEKIYREIRDNDSLQYNVVGFLDDSKKKIGRTIHGIPVIGRIDDMVQAINKVDANEALISIPSANGSQMRRIVDLCKSSGIPFKTVPGYGELINGRVSVKAIRDVAYRDLLGREVIKLDEEGIGAYINDQRVLVTGAGGSIGSELCRQICRFKPSKVVLFERAESLLYDIELELRAAFRDIQIVPVLGDVQKQMHLRKAFDNQKPHTVFHAAAYKHVPMLEIQPWRAIENNILGTDNVVSEAIRNQVDRFVFVSTDKAVRPANVMGASKRVAEMLIQCQNHQSNLKTRFAIVRFGNVVGSVGSVIPLFRKQIEKGGPVTVTHPDMTRFFMTIPEACQLILQAGSLMQGKKVEVFVLDMGTPVNISDMARDLIRLSGFEPDVDIKIEYIGIRPGEKLYEELITDGEGIVRTSHEKIMALQGDICHVEELNSTIDQLRKLSTSHDGEEIKAKLKRIVADYQPSGSSEDIQFIPELTEIETVD
jgi:FlaA1/EpsC-like NDP-sugar epimerase